MLAKDLPCSGRALVPLTREPVRVQTVRAPTRPAAFLAHLIAAAKQVPQARERRRADPAEAIAAYQAMVRISSR